MELRNAEVDRGRNPPNVFAQRVEKRRARVKSNRARPSVDERNRGPSLHGLRLLRGKRAIGATDNAAPDAVASKKDRRLKFGTIRTAGQSLIG
jgi:hypothetical protein